MTMFICYPPDQHKAKQEYLGNNSNNIANNVTKASQKSIQENTGIACSIRVAWICSILLFFLIGILTTIAYRYQSTTNNFNSCKCSKDTDGILLRLEELERKVNLFEQSVPAVLYDRPQV